MPDTNATTPEDKQKPDDGGAKTGNVEWTYSPSNPPNLHAKPLIKSRLDLQGLRKELERVGVKPE
jgi:hypothetical protein